MSSSVQKKALFGIALAFTSLVVGVFALQNFAALPAKNFSETINHDGEIRFDSRRIAANPLLAPYDDMDTYLSAEIEASRPFTSVGGYWEEIKPSGTNIEALVRLRSNGEWSEWLELEEEIESENGNVSRKFAVASGNLSDAVQYKFMLYSDGVYTPVVRDLSWTFIRATASVNATPAATPQYASSALVSEATAVALTAKSSSTEVISRKSWGANESYRYLKDNTKDADLIEIPSETYEKYKKELTYSKVVAKDSSGKKYVWPLQYPEKVKKFIIHHTATTKNLNDPRQAIRDIYYYHAITRGWGDIGYNYIFDQDGRVYEGRYGGDGVIGAHAGIGNNGSVGIAVLGDFESSKVPDKVIKALGTFIGAKAKIHKIKPDGKSTFRGKNSPNIIGHRDIMATTCPGGYLYSKLATLRSLGASTYSKSSKNEYTEEYAYEDKSDLPYLELQPNETQTLTIKLKNIGKVEWDRNTFIVVDKNPEFDGLITFPGATIDNLAKMKEKTVKPGKTATFEFEIKAGNRSGSATMRIAPLYNGTKKSSDYIILPVSVQQGDYKYKLVDSKLPPSIMKPGEEFVGWVKLKNIGNTTWNREGTGMVKIGTDHPQDRKSVFLSGDANRFGYLAEKSVKPDETGTFIIRVTAPEKEGFYQEYFTPVVEGITWMEDNGLYFETLVGNAEKYSAELVGKSTLNVWQPGRGYVIWLQIRNTGTQTWSAGKMTMVFDKDSDLKIENPKLKEKSVKTGEVGTLEFRVVIDSKDEKGNKVLKVTPKISGKTLFSTPLTFEYTVGDSSGTSSSGNSSGSGTSGTSGSSSSSNSSGASGNSSSSGTTTTTSGTEGNIRVHLSKFSGNPKISAADSMGIYVAGKLLATIDKNKTATVTYSNNRYRVEAGSKVYTSSMPVVFRSDGILTIENFENRPAWNTSLNDNQYRGSLEVRYLDSLIVINELPLEDYLKGLGEVSNSEQYEKIKAVIVAARTYARYYTTVAKKFPGKPYDLNDDPNVSQKYLGYGLEKRSATVSKAVDATRGEMVTYKGALVKTPYFSQSDGKATKSAQAVWGWKDTPYLVSVKDTYCNATSFLGHGVGLSGCGAKGMAEKGFGYKEILKYYYTGVEISDFY